MKTTTLLVMDSVLEVNLLNGIKIDTEHERSLCCCKIIVKVISVCFVLQQKVSPTYRGNVHTFASDSLFPRRVKSYFETF